MYSSLCEMDETLRLEFTWLFVYTYMLSVSSSTRTRFCPFVRPGEIWRLAFACLRLRSSALSLRVRVKGCSYDGVYSLLSEAFSDKLEQSVRTPTEQQNTNGADLQLTNCPPEQNAMRTVVCKSHMQRHNVNVNVRMTSKIMK